MQQFLTTPPAGSMNTPAIARKLLLPSPSSQPCDQEIGSPLPCSVSSLVPLNGGYMEGQQTSLPMLDGARSSKTIYVQRFVPVLTPNTLLQMQAQGSPPCGTITTAGSHVSCMSIVTSSNGMPVGELPLITQTAGDSLFGTSLYPSAGVCTNSRLPTSPLGGPTQGNKRSPDCGIFRDSEYEAVMKHLKVSHQPGESWIPVTSYPSPQPSSCYDDHSPTSGSPLPHDHRVSNGAILPPLVVEKINGWYDPISDTPSGHMTKKDNKRSRKQISRLTKGRKVRSKGRSLKVDQLKVDQLKVDQLKGFCVEHPFTVKPLPLRNPHCFLCAL